MRAGQLDPQRIELASALGHPVARLVRPDVVEVNWASWQARREALRRVTEVVGGPTVVRWAADVAERVLLAWEANHPDDPRPREAIEAARAWADCPCQDHADAAHDAAYAAAYADAAYHAAAAAYAAYHDAADAAHDAAYAAAYAAYAADASDDEREWQRLRLAAYVLGEV